MARDLSRYMDSPVPRKRKHTEEVGLTIVDDDDFSAPAPAPKKKRKHKPAEISRRTSTGSDTIPTRILIISDTHEHELKGQIMPEVDILLHAGDLTECGELSALKKSIAMMGTIKAELKLVIAGNHDLFLDKSHRIKNWDNPADDYTNEQYEQRHQSAVEAITGPDAKKAGVTYLQEGTHHFTLTNGACFSIYVSPYTPDVSDGEWAFQYPAHQDRYNSGATNPIPNYVHIIMTHGPPKGYLDQTEAGNAGCGHLLRAVSRAKPLLHCFGHIHGGRGTELVTWNNNSKSTTKTSNTLVSKYPRATKPIMEEGHQTLMVNAAIMDHSTTHDPMMVEINLPNAKNKKRENFP